MIGFIVQDVRVNKMVSTKNRYIPLNVSQVGHFWTPKIHGNPSDHGGTLDGNQHFVHIFKVVDNVGYRGVDEGIPTSLPSSVDDIAGRVDVQHKPDDLRTGPITRACAMLLEQQVNSLLT
jgi:hypothetical protein